MRPGSPSYRNRLEGRGALSVAARGLDANGNVIPPEPSPGPGRMARARSNSDATEVLEIMSRIPLSWHDLYKVHEIICRSMENTTPVALGWTTGKKESAFTNSANNPTISGGEARHARPPKGDQSNRKMTKDEGRSYIRDLVTRWLDSLG
jgi:hypothetical protein